MDEHPVSQFTFGSHAHVKFLEALSDEEFWRYASGIARASPQFPTRFDEYLICELGKAYCVLPLALLNEVLPAPQHITLLPSVPAWMAGLATWRDRVIAVVDLAAYFANAETSLPRTGCMLLIVNHDNMTLGLLAPVVEAMTNLDMEQLCPPEQLRNEDRDLFPCQGAIKGVIKDVRAVAGADDVVELLLLDIPVILADIVQRIKVNVSYDG